MSAAGVLIFFAIVGASSAPARGSRVAPSCSPSSPSCCSSARRSAPGLPGAVAASCPRSSTSALRCRLTGTSAVPDERRREWRTRAACRERTAELFFPTAERRSGLRGAGRRGQGRVRAVARSGPSASTRPWCASRRDRGRAHPRGATRRERPPTAASSSRPAPRGRRRGEREAAGRVLLGRRPPGARGRPLLRGRRTHRRALGRPRPRATTRPGRRGAPAATGLPSRSPRRPTPRQGHERRKDPERR